MGGEGWGRFATERHFESILSPQRVCERSRGVSDNKQQHTRALSPQLVHPTKVNNRSVVALLCRLFASSRARFTKLNADVCVLTSGPSIPRAHLYIVKLADMAPYSENSYRISLRTGGNILIAVVDCFACKN